MKTTEQQRNLLFNAAVAATEFIYKEYRSEQWVAEHGHIIAPEARKIWDQLVDAIYECVK